MSSIVSSFPISSIAKKLICENHTNEEIVSVHETLSHDDYDDEGPKSNLYDLFIVGKHNDDEYKYYYYHRENWFSGAACDHCYYLEEKQESRIFLEIKNMSDWAYYFKY